MRAKLLLFLAVTMWLPCSALAADRSPADAILGKWWFPKRDGWMEITRDGEKFVGKVVAYEDPTGLDDHNPDPKLQTRPFVGITMMNDFKFDPKSNKWTEGTIYDGESGKTYKGNMWFENGDLSKLNARGYIGFSLLGRTEIFTRVTKEEEPRGVPVKIKEKSGKTKDKRGTARK